ncbi:MAG: hypothetical protein ABEL04_15795 [Salinibacter sp.]|uniref:hypothetical protein n=1 Tax=Salinibacter sp. TaxID=2065818 RepID=UPI0035D40954
MSRALVWAFGLFLTAGLLLTGCTRPSAAPKPKPAAITDSAYLTADLWNDGRAEVAFYQVRRTQDQYGRPNEQRFLVGTYLVKHRFSPSQMTKVTDGSSGTSAFKYALFYELESGSYQYKRNWVVNARQENLRPFKQSFTSFDWCSNQYRELAFTPDGPIEVRMRSDDYGNRRTSFAVKAHSYPPAQLPMLVRSLDFSETDTVSFNVAVAEEGKHVSARAVRGGVERVETEAGSYPAERVTVTYDTAVPSPIGEESAQTEIYWRGTGSERLLLKMRAQNERYRMTLVEQLRTPYWKENLWPKLDRVEGRP